MSTPRINCPNCKTMMPYTAAACPGCGRRMVSVSSKAKDAQGSALDVYLGTPYSECRAQDCVFNVTGRDTTCPNCGISNPFKERGSPELATALSSNWAGCVVFLSMLALAVILAVVGGKMMRPGGNVAPLVVITTIISIVVPLLIFFRLQRKAGLIADRAPTPEYTGASLTLKSSESIIQQRVNDLKTREQQITAVIGRAKHNTGEQWEKVRETLNGALETVLNQSTRYNLKLTEIKLVRWQNKLAPLLYGWERLNYEQNEARLKALEITRSTGSDIQSKAVEYRKILGSTPDVEELSNRLKETLESYRKVHDGLVARQAVLAMQGVSPMQDALSPASLPTVGKREVEVFNAQVSITDFSHSFAELEAEYTRLQSEEDVAQEIIRILQKIEPD